LEWLHNLGVRIFEAGSDIDVTKKEPRDDQLKAMQAVIDGFKQRDRGQLILPCGAGKTLVSLWIKEALNTRHTLVLVPSLALLRQIKNQWSTHGERFIPYICVCSEKDIDKGVDQQIVHTYEISGKVSTNASEVRQFLNSHSETIVYSTYQSLEVVCDAINESMFEFDLAICDEAHKTSGSKFNKFAVVHSNANIAIKKRLYMTATPRIVSENVKSKLSDEVVKYIYDMSNPEVFGLEFYRMSFREAIKEEILVDYKIIAIGVSDQELCHAINQRKYISETETIDEVANNYALEKFMQLYGPTHAITFHSSVIKAKEFQARHIEAYPETTAFHVNGQLTTNDRNIRMKEFEQSTKAVMTNARCLTEGVDVPAIDIVYFCDPKNSKIDIVQAAGRTLRRADYKGKRFGYIVVPIFHREKSSLQEVINDSPFKNLINIISALCSHDERLVDELKQIKLEKGSRNIATQHVAVDSFCNLITIEGFHENLKESLFFQGISKTRVPWKPFEEARAYVHALKLNGKKDWEEYCISGQRPPDIPASPEKTYKYQGWSGWGDWVGTGNKHPGDNSFLPFEEARAFVRTLGIKTQKEWQAYAMSGNRPDYIPVNPAQVYEKKGWINLGDWLGSGVKHPGYKECIPYAEAEKYARDLGLKNEKEWRMHWKLHRPDNIPAKADNYYRKTGDWVDWGTFLGTGVIQSQKMEKRPFQQARAFVHTLKLKSGAEWKKYCDSDNKPPDIPKNPRGAYKKQGWVNLGDWLGTNNVHTHKRVYLSYEEAKKIIHQFEIKSVAAWRRFSKSDLMPKNIPSAPNTHYENLGWINWYDWLGKCNPFPQLE
jgi:superfamily II DNA or RNA helicase